jgi:hypothetical protein
MCFVVYSLVTPVIESYYTQHALRFSHSRVVYSTAAHACPSSSPQCLLPVLVSTLCTALSLPLLHSMHMCDQ